MLRTRKFPRYFVLVLISTLILFHTPPAWAHKMTVEVHIESGAQVTGAARYHTTPVVNAKVKILAPDGNVLTETATNEKGVFAFVAKYRCDHTVVVVDGAHRGQTTLHAEDLPNDLPEYEKK